MRIFFYIGLLLLALSFMAAASENASYAVSGSVRKFILPAHDLWYALSPQSFIIFEIRVERLLGEWAWDPLILTLLKLPAWLLFGGPGVALVVYFRPHRGHFRGNEIAEVEKHYEFFDQLALQARQENPPDEDHGPRDIMPEQPIEDDETIDAKGSHPDKD
jgi:hypothetical protein